MNVTADEQVIELTDGLMNDDPPIIFGNLNGGDEPNTYINRTTACVYVFNFIPYTYSQFSKVEILVQQSNYEIFE